MPTVKKVVGPYDPSPFEDYANRITSFTQNARTKLAKYSLEEIENLFFLREKHSGRLARPAFELFGYEIDDLTRNEPIWFYGGFGNEEHRADYEYWSRIEAVSLDEATSLTIGFSPKSCDEDLFAKVSKESQKFRHIPEFYFDRREQIDRKFQLSYLEKKVKSSDLLNWVESVDLNVPDEFLTSFRKIVCRSAGNKSAILDASLDPREKTSLLQVIALMAKDGYRYNEIGRSTLPTELHEAARLNDVPITKETIRKHLKTAAGVLKGPWKVD